MTIKTNHAELLTAAQNVAEVLSECATDVGEHFTCSEAEVIASLMRAAGREEDAEYWLDGHALGDDEGDSHWDRHEKGE